MDCFEVYHGHWLTGNDKVLKTYDRFLSDGKRIPLLGGSDYHQPEELKPLGPIGLGRPTTVLWLEHLDAKSVVEGLKAGHGYVTESTNGPHLAFTVNGQPMGSVLATDGKVTIDVEVNGAAGDRLVWVSDAGVIADDIIPSDTWQHNFDLQAPAKFLRAEIVAEHSKERLIGELLDWYKEQTEYRRSQQSLTNPPPIRRTLSNPVFFGVLTPAKSQL